MTPLLGRFEAKVSPEPNSGCWLWTGSIDPKGYGQIRVSKNELRLATHIMLEFYGIGVPRDKVVMHKCDNPACVNPDHLKIGTQKENMQDSLLKGRNDQTGLRLGWGWQRMPAEQLARLRECFAAGLSQSEAARQVAVAKGVALFWFKKWGHTTRPMLQRTHCAHGHLFAGDNLRIKPNGDRECRTCARLANRLSKRRRRAQRAAA